MGIYIFVLTLVFGGFLFFYRRPSYKGYNTILFIVVLIICFGYMPGSDWRAYELIYDSYSEKDNFYWRFLFMEPMYLCLNIIGNELHLNFWAFFIILKVVMFCKIALIIKRFCPKELYLLAFTFYLGFWGIMNFMDPSLRNMIAAFIFMCSIDAVINRKFWHFFLWILLAASFHYSSIVLILFYFILNRKFSNRSIVICFVIVNIVFLNANVTFAIAEKIFSSVPIIVTKINSYTTGEESDLGQGKMLSFAYIMHVAFFVLILHYRRELEKIQNGKFLFNISVLFIFIFRIGLTSLIFSRFQLFIGCFYSVTIASVIYSFFKQYRLLYVVGIYCLSLIANYGQMKDVLFVPYTNYLLYYNSDLSYDYRSEYNFRNSPYKSNKRK